MKFALDNKYKTDIDFWLGEIQVMREKLNNYVGSDILDDEFESYTLEQLYNHYVESYSQILLAMNSWETE